MKTSSIWNFRSIAGNIITGLVLAVMICSIDAAPALGRDDRRTGNHDNGRYEERGRGHGNHRYLHGRRVNRRHDNRRRVYVSPPVIFVPPPPPGIGIFFPPFFFHR